MDNKSEIQFYQQHFQKIFFKINENEYFSPLSPLYDCEILF